MKIVIGWSLVGVVLLGGLPAGGQTGQAPPIVAVFLMESRGSPLKADEVVGLTDYMATRLGENGNFQIIPRDEIRKRLVDQRNKSYKDCVDQSCQIEVGRELAAQYTISSNISKVGNMCLITAQLFDLRKATTAKSASEKTSCSPENLIVAVESITDKIEEAMTGQPVQREPDTAEVPDERPAPVQHAGANEWSSTGNSGSTPTAAPPPAPEPAPAEPVDPNYRPVYKRWWFWTLIGVGTVAVLTALLYLSGALDDGTYDSEYYYLQSANRAPGIPTGGAVLFSF